VHDGLRARISLASNRPDIIATLSQFGGHAMPRKLVLLSTLLVTLAVASTASATKPIRKVHPSQGDAVIARQCAFPVLGHIDGPEIIKRFLDQAGNPVKGIVTFPGNKITLTNADTGASVIVLGTGESQLRAEPDGSFTARAMGHGIFYPNPITGERGIFYLSGQGKSILDADGNLISSALHGRLVDLCPRLDS
jgi:hypothetical protein